jgi:hypothetical protein
MRKVAIVDIAEESSFFLKRSEGGFSFFEIETASLGVYDSQEKKLQTIKTKLSIGPLDRKGFTECYSGSLPFVILLPEELAFVNMVNKSTLVLDDSEEIKNLFAWEERHDFLKNTKNMSFLPSSNTERNPWKVRWSLRKFWDSDEFS